MQTVVPRTAGPGDLCVVTPAKRHDSMTFQTSHGGSEQEWRKEESEVKKGKRGQFPFLDQSREMNPGVCFMGPGRADRYSPPLLSP